MVHGHKHKGKVRNVECWDSGYADHWTDSVHLRGTVPQRGVHTGRHWNQHQADGKDTRSTICQLALLTCTHKDSCAIENKKPNAWSLSCCRNKLKFVVCSCNLIIREKESEFHIHHDNPQIYHRGISSLRRNNSPVKEQTIKCCEGTIRPGHNANVILFLLIHLPPACRACFLEAWAQQKWSEAGGCCVYLLGILLGTR